MTTTAADITLRQGEAKTLKFTVTCEKGVAANLSTATMYFAVKKKKRNDVILIEKAHASFDMSQAVSGIVTVPVSAADTSLYPGRYEGELKTTFSASNIDKSADIIIDIERSVA